MARTVKIRNNEKYITRFHSDHIFCLCCFPLSRKKKKSKRWKATKAVCSFTVRHHYKFSQFIFSFFFFSQIYYELL